jgi:hypothetical protein
VGEQQVFWKVVVFSQENTSGCLAQAAILGKIFGIEWNLAWTAAEAERA